MTRLIQNIRNGIKTRTAKFVLASAAAVGTLGMIPANTFAGERDYRGDRYDRYDDRGAVRVDVGYRPVYQARTEQFWVEPVYRTVCDRVWVAPVVRDECEQVWVPEVFEVREVVHGYGWRKYVTRERICVAPGHFEERRRQVVVVPGHYDNVERQELVVAGHWEYRTQPVRVVQRPAWNFSLGFWGH